MSIYTSCSEAARRLIDEPNLRPVTRGPEGVFTELDVILLAARQEGGYSESQMKIAQREASQVMGTLFREGKAVRFGPVTIPDESVEDYVRVCSKIAYASAEGPKTIETPNGTFRRLLAKSDKIKARPGPRLGYARDDLEPWVTTEAHTAVQRENVRLKAENAALRSRMEDLERESDRLRQHIAKMTAERERAA